MSRSSRYLPGIALLAIGCAVGCAKKEAGGSPEILPIKKGIVANVVGPKACDLKYPKVQISKTDGEVAIWVAKKKTDTVRIEFADEVFEGMKKNAKGKWVPKDCDPPTRICDSGNINASVVPSDHEYKYDQFLIDENGTEDPCDGHMIINP